MPAKSPDPPAKRTPDPKRKPEVGGDVVKEGGLLSRIRDYLGLPVVDADEIAAGAKADRPARAVASVPVITKTTRTKNKRMQRSYSGQDLGEGNPVSEMEKSLQEYLHRRLRYRKEAERLSKAQARTERPASQEAPGDRERRTRELEELLAESKEAEGAINVDEANELIATLKPDADIRDMSEMDVPGLHSAKKKKVEATPVEKPAALASPNKAPSAAPPATKDGLFRSLLQGIRDLRSRFDASAQDLERVKKAMERLPAARAESAQAPAVPASSGGRILSGPKDANPSTPLRSSTPATPPSVDRPAPAAAPQSAVAGQPDGTPGPGSEGFLTSLLENFGKDEKANKENRANRASTANKDGKKEEVKKEEPKKEEKKDEKKEEVKVAAKPKKPGRLSSGGFAEFIGALKYFGMGRERLAIVQNLATMLNAGLPLVDSIRTLQMETKSKPTKKLLQRIVESVEGGSALWRAMEEQHFFSPHAIALIRIGEEAGNLAENMAYLAIQQEKDAGLRAKVKMAMIYPTIVMVLMFIIVIGLGMFVLPNLIQVLFSLNVKLPLVTRMVIAFTNGFTQYGTIVIPSFLAGVAVLVILGKFTPLKVVFQWFLFAIPGIGRLATEATLARFGVILGGLLQAGVPLVDALRSLAEVTPMVRFRKFYFRLLEHITVGDSFSKSFAVIRGSGRVIPVSVQQLIITGERTGSLAKIMLKIADIYEKKANDTAQKLPVILEPMLLLFIGALVGTIAFAIIIPIYSIVGNVGK